MTGGTQVRVTIGINSVPRGILSVHKRPKGDVGIYLRAARHFGNNDDLILGEPLHEFHYKIIKNQYYSVHPSNSSDLINAIKHTITFEDDSELESSHYTEALKVHNRNVFLFSRKYSNLETSEYNVKKDNKIPSISLGDFNQKKFSLSLSVFISNASLEFKLTASDSNVAQFTIGDYRIVLIWSFITLASLGGSRFIHNRNFSKKDLGNDPKLIKIFESTKAGFLEPDCFDVHRTNGNYFLAELKKVYASNEGIPIDVLNRVLAVATLLKTPSATSPEFLRHLGVVFGVPLKYSVKPD